MVGQARKSLLATLMKCLMTFALISLLVSDTTVVTTQYISSFGICMKSHGDHMLHQTLNRPTRTVH